MGRIDEALRRSGVATASEVTSGGDIFISPWDGKGTVEWSPQVTSRDDGARLPERPSGASFAIFESAWRDTLAATAGDARFIEQFRRLGATLVHNARAERLKILLVTSAVPGDGKTLTAMHLSLVLSESYRRRLLLIDADLRRPSLSQAARLGSADGLSQLLKAPDERKASVVQLTDTLTLLPAGRPDGDPLGGFASARMRRLLEDAAQRFDWIILDAPPVEVAADGSLLAAMSDAVLLVVRAGQTQYPALQRTVETIGRDRILGVVLNDVEMENTDYLYGYPPSVPK